MRWQGRRESENVEDRRDDGGASDDGGGGGSGFPFPGGGGGGFQIPMGQGGGIGIVGLIIIAGIALLLGVDPRMILKAAAVRRCRADGISSSRATRGSAASAPKMTA